MATLGEEISERRKSAGLTQEQLALRVNWSQSRISRVEHDEAIPPPSVIVRLDEILSAGGALIELHREAVAERQRARLARRANGKLHERARPPETDRRSLIVAAAGVVFGARPPESVLSLLADADGKASLSRITEADVANLEHTTALLADLDHKQGGEPSRNLLLGELRWAHSLLGRSCMPGVRRRLQIAIANLADLTAWATADAGQLDRSRSLFLYALSIAHESDDSGILAHVATGWARMEIHARDPKSALDLVRLARAGKDDLPSAAVAMLNTVAAMAYARLPDVHECERRLGIAEQVFRPPAPDDPVWIAYFTSAKMKGDAGSALYDLALMTGRTRSDLIDPLTDAVRTYAPERIRSKAIAAARLGTVLYRARQPEEAASSAALATQLSGAVRSAWLSAALDDLAEAATAYPTDETASSIARTLAHARRTR